MKINAYTLIILRYFDINDQTLKTIQFILWKNSENMTKERLCDYVKNDFIPMTGIDNKWHKELKKSLCKMSQNEQECEDNNDLITMFNQVTTVKWQRRRRSSLLFKMIKSRSSTTSKNAEVCYLDDFETLNSDAIHKHQQFLLLDSRKVVILQADEKNAHRIHARRFDADKDTFEVIKDHKLVILRYF